MGRKGKRGKKGAARQQVRGFRPGKEPAELRKRRAKANLGQDASWAQKAMVDTVADRSPDQVRAMLQRWSIALLAGTVVLALVGAFLYGRSVIAAIAVHAFAVGLLVLWIRIRRHGARLIEMAERMRGGRAG